MLPIATQMVDYMEVPSTTMLAQIGCSVICRMSLVVWMLSPAFICLNLSRRIEDAENMC